MSQNENTGMGRRDFVRGAIYSAAAAAMALDVMCAPVQMKKNRPGTLITVLSDPDKSALLQVLLLRETSSLGLRVREERRVCQPRKFVTVTTEWDQVRIKVAHRDDVEWNASPKTSHSNASWKRPSALIETSLVYNAPRAHAEARPHVKTRINCDSILVLSKHFARVAVHAEAGEKNKWLNSVRLIPAQRGPPLLGFVFYQRIV